MESAIRSAVPSRRGRSRVWQRILGRRLAVASLVWTMAPSLGAQPASLPEEHRVRLAEAFSIAESFTDSLWPGWSEVSFAVLLVIGEHEFLLRHPRPSPDFELLVEHDSMLGSPVYARERQFAPTLLATFPAVGGVPTIVVGTPDRTGKTSTQWVLTLLHEHLHQLQSTQPDYYTASAALDLANGDETGMWMLDYEFPYDDPKVGAEVAAFAAALREALYTESPDAGAAREAVLRARRVLQGSLHDADYRYLSFQLWQEGVARFIELRIAEMAARYHEPRPEMRALADYEPYGDSARDLRDALERDLSELDLQEQRRVAFYALGAAEALLLDTIAPRWREGYLEEKFDLEPHYQRH